MCAISTLLEYTQVYKVHVHFTKQKNTSSPDWYCRKQLLKAAVMHSMISHGWASHTQSEAHLQDQRNFLVNLLVMLAQLSTQ